MCRRILFAAFVAAVVAVGPAGDDQRLARRHILEALDLEPQSEDRPAQARGQLASHPPAQAATRCEGPTARWMGRLIPDVVEVHEQYCRRPPASG